MKEFRMVVHSRGEAFIRAETKAAALRRARDGDFDGYVLRAPDVQITSLAEGEPLRTALLPRENVVVFERMPAGSLEGYMDRGGR